MTSTVLDLHQKIQTDPQYQRVFLQEKSKLSLRFFCKDILGFKDLNAEHEALCEFLQHDPAPIKLMLMPRYTFKSSIITIAHSLWLLLNDPNERILLYSDATEKAEGFLTGIKNHIGGAVQGSLFRAVFGPWEIDPKRGVWNQGAITVSPRTSAAVEPSIETAGIETSKVGKHYSRLKFDDLVSDKNVTTKDLMDKVESVYKNAGSLLQPSGKVDMAGTRWHYVDLYGRLIEEHRGDPRFAIFLRKAEDGGKYFFQDIGKDSLTPGFLEQKKASQGSYLYSCNPAEAPILMGDFSSQPISQVRAGDEVVGFTTYDGQRQRRLVKTTVLKVQSRIAPIVKVTLQSGRVIRCTAEHRWYTGRTPHDPTHPEYAPAKVGRRLLFVMEPIMLPLPLAQTATASWLGGMFDGEGHCGMGSINIAQSRSHNPQVVAAVEQAVQTLGFDYKQSPAGDTVINGSFEEKRRFVHWCNPVKKTKILENIYRRGGKFIREQDPVVSILSDGEEPVYALVTGTGNYVAWGYASKNCLYQNEPVDSDTALFKSSDFTFYTKPVTEEARLRFVQELFLSCCLDPATGKEKAQDRAALSVVGTDSDLNMYVLDLVSGSMTPAQQVEQVFSLYHKWKFHTFGIEVNAFQEMLHRDVEFRYAEERQRNPQFRLFLIEKFTASSVSTKEMRIRALQPYHERHALRIPGEGLATLPHPYSDLTVQMLQYTPSHKPEHEDELDSLAYHVLIHRPGRTILPKQTLPVTSAAWYEKEVWLKEQRKELQRRPRWHRAPVPQLAFS